MILPIVAYGTPVLRKTATEIEQNYPDLQQLIDNMYETMYNANGVGLAAPQIGRSIRLFIIDSKQVTDEQHEDNEFREEEGIVQTFINAQVVEESGKDWVYEEGCLSIPNIRENVSRPSDVRIQYYDADFNFHDKTYSGLTARVILHEYDHIEGKLFTEYLSALKKRLLKSKLTKISKGQIKADYRMKFPVRRR